MPTYTCYGPSPERLKRIKDFRKKYEALGLSPQKISKLVSRKFK